MTQQQENQPLYHDNGQLREQLEKFLDYREQRIANCNVNSFSKSNLFYKEVLPEAADCTSGNVDITLEKKTPKAVQPAAAKTDPWDCYTGYASKVLETIAVVTAPPTACPSANGDCGGVPAVETAGCQTNVAAVYQQNCLLDEAYTMQQKEMAQQLNRMEQMLREIYTCNQELYKSLIHYCKTYTIN